MAYRAHRNRSENAGVSSSDKFCGRLVDACPPPGDRRPKPTLEAWTRRSPNVYTQVSSKDASCSSHAYTALAAGSTYTALATGRPTDADVDAYARAAAALASPDMLVLRTEDLDSSWGRLDAYLGRQPGEGIAKPTTRANAHRGDLYAPTSAERARIATVDHFDVALYEAIARDSSGKGSDAKALVSAGRGGPRGPRHIRTTAPKVRRRVRTRAKAPGPLRDLEGTYCGRR